MSDTKRLEAGEVRLETARREQLELVPTIIDELIAADQPREGQSKAVAAWRRRMGISRGREIYKLRASTAETVNADLRCFRGLDRFLVRTLPKVTCVVLWSVIAYDLMRFFKLTH
ncbi:MAG: transposase [Planctomycetes bacterium]|nr:transposase [Planctomycetota bacterium]